LKKLIIDFISNVRQKSKKVKNAARNASKIVPPTNPKIIKKGLIVISITSPNVVDKSKFVKNLIRADTTIAPSS
jgi:hypothetical protein